MAFFSDRQVDVLLARPPQPISGIPYRTLYGGGGTFDRKRDSPRRVRKARALK